MCEAGADAGGPVFKYTVNVWNTHSGSYVNLQPSPFMLQGLGERAKGPLQLNDSFVHLY